jgi:hypothetical protein
MRYIVIAVVWLLSVIHAHARIGDVEQQVGNSVIERQGGDAVTSETGLDILSMDTVKTANGRTSIVFVDDTRVDVTENSKLIIDEFVYDPNTQTGELALKASLGTVRYASGQIAKNSRQNVKIKTPTATIGVRGTDFSMTIDEIGGSTIILLPSCTIIDSTRVCSVGEISVESDIGTVILNQAFQATHVETLKSSPLNPILLDLSESMINNLLIITPPEELEEDTVNDIVKRISSELDLDFLEFQELNRDYLNELEKDQWMTDLDFDPLSGDFLFDALERSLEAIQAQMEADTLKARSENKLGYDPATGVTLMNQDPYWVYIRDDGAGNYVRMNLHQSSNYSINHDQSGNEIFNYQINTDGGGADSYIDIKQVQ